MALVQRVELGLRRGLQVQQALVGPWQHPQDLIELALHRGLLPHLGVLQREDHHQRHGRGRSSGGEVTTADYPMAPRASDTEGSRSCRLRHALRYSAGHVRTRP